MTIEKIRELTGFLISTVAAHDCEHAKHIADELEELLPKQD